MFMNDSKFWSSINGAWARMEFVDENGRTFRSALLEGDTELARATLLMFTSSLVAELDEGFSAAEICAFFETFERKMHLLDREELATYVGVGGAAFASARALIVALGEFQYHAVKAAPQAARNTAQLAGRAPDCFLAARRTLQHLRP